MDWPTVYKVVHPRGDKLVSAANIVQPLGRFSLTYKIGEFVSPVKDTVIYCFDTLINAERWVKFMGSHDILEIWEATGKHARVDKSLNPVSALNSIDEFWVTILNKQTNYLTQVNYSGVLVCDELRLDKKV